MRALWNICPSSELSTPGQCARDQVRQALEEQHWQQLGRAALARKGELAMSPECLTQEDQLE